MSRIEQEENQQTPDEKSGEPMYDPSSSTGEADGSAPFRHRRISLLARVRRFFSRTFRRLADTVFGYDFFISYSWRDKDKLGRRYALALKDRLTDLGFVCFLDSADYEKGDDWKEFGQIALRRTRKLLLVATPAIFGSEPVLREIRLFRRTGRQIVPIEIRGTLANADPKHELVALIPSTRLHVVESPQDPLEGPSNGVVEDIHNSFRLARQKTIRRRVVTVIIVLLTGLSFWANQQRQQAADNERLATYQRDNALRTESRFLAGFSQELRNAGAVSDAMALALSALPEEQDYSDRPLVAEAVAALVESRYELYELSSLRPDNEPIKSLILNEDSTNMLTLSEAGIVRVWQMPEGEQLGVIENKKSAIEVAAINSKERLIVAGSKDGTIQIWHSDLRKILLHVQHGDVPISAVAINRNGSLLAVGDTDGGVRIRNVSDGDLVATLSGHTGTIRKILFSPDGRLLFTGSLDGSGRFWRVDGGSMISELLQGDVISAEFSPDGDTLLTGTPTGGLYFWKVHRSSWRYPNGDLIAQYTSAHNGAVTSVAYSSSGETMLSVSTDGTARLWSALDGKPLMSDGSAAYAVSILSGRSASGKSVVLGEDTRSITSASFTADGAGVLTGAADGIVQLWSVHSGETLATLQSDTSAVNQVITDVTGRFAVSGSQSGQITVWNPSRPREVNVHDTGGAKILSMAVAPRGDKILTGAHDGTIHLWDGDATNWERTFNVGAGQVSNVAFDQSGDTFLVGAKNGDLHIFRTPGDGELVVSLATGLSGISKLVTHPGKSLVLLISRNNIAQLRNSLDGSLIVTLRGHEKTIRDGVLSADGNHVVTVSDDQTARVWRVANVNQVRVLRGHDSAIVSVAFDPDGEWFVTASRDQTARIWSVGDDLPKATMTGHTGMIRDVAVSPDDDQIVTASVDGTARIWSADTGQIIKALKGHERSIVSANFSPDGRWVLTASRDKTARLWPIENAQGSVVLRGHVRPLVAAKFAGKPRIMTASWDGALRIWPWWRSVPELIESSNEIVERLKPLSLAERCRFYQEPEEKCLEFRN